eukprot:scaffold83592_cov31-Tisochrysis_lutea.AAC.1
MLRLGLPTSLPNGGRRNTSPMIRALPAVRHAAPAIRYAAPGSVSASPAQRVRMCSSGSGGGSDRLHSTDIAFKPTQDGWGFSRSYSDGWDKIFKKKSRETGEPASSSPAQDAAADSAFKTRMSLLQQAFDGDALSRTLFDQVFTHAMRLAVPAPVDSACTESIHGHRRRRKRSFWREGRFELIIP